MSLPSLLRALRGPPVLPVLPMLLTVAAVVLAPGCAGSGGGTAGGASLHDLDTTPGAVRGWFETHQAHPRAILLLSPV